MPWWGWIIVGAVLLGAELLAVDAGFYLVFIGIAAAITGLLGLFGVPLPEWGEWLSFAVLSLVLLYFFRGPLYHRIRGSLPGYSQDPRGSRIVIDAALAPGETARHEFRGSQWSVENVGTDAIAAGETVLIRSVEGLTLKIARGDNGTAS